MPDRFNQQARKAARAEFVTRMFILVLIGALATAVVMIVQIRSTQVDRLPQTEKNDETLALIKDCTQPDGECYKRGQAQTAQAVGDINRVIIIAAACASKPEAQTVEQIADCVTRQLAANE